MLRLAKDCRRCIRSLREHRSGVRNGPIPDLASWSIESVPLDSSGLVGDLIREKPVPAIWAARGAPHQIDDALELIAFLCTVRAEEKQGRKKQRELQWLIGEIYDVFKDAGGKSTAYWNSYANDKMGDYRGRLLDMVAEILDQIEFKYASRIALAQAIKAVISARRRITTSSHMATIERTVK